MSPYVLLTFLLAPPPTAPAQPAANVASAEQDVESGSFDALMADADAARSNNDSSAALRLHVRAHRALAPADRVGLMGEIAIENALDDLDASPMPEEDGAALHPWLVQAVDERQAAHRRDEAGPVPERWLTTLEALTPPEPPPEPEVEAPIAPAPVDPAPARRTTPTRDRALLGTGIGLTLAGAGLLGGGIAVLGRVADQPEEPQWPSPSAAQSPEADAYRDDLDQWQSRGRGIGTGLIVGGALVATGGIVLTTWSAVRMRKQRLDLAFAPWWSGTGGGLAVRIGGRS